MSLPRRSFLLHSGVLGSTLFASGALAGAPAVHTGRRGTKGDVLVLGGTGFLGPHLVDALRARGFTPVLFNRGRTNADLFPDLEKLHGDRDPDVGEGLSALEGERRFAYAIDTSSYVPRITRAACRLLADRVEAYSLVSSVSVYPDLRTPGLHEGSPVGRLEDTTVEKITNETYGPLKALCEEAAEECLPGRVLNVRPGLIVGPRDPTPRFTYWPVRIQEGGEVLVPGKHDDPVQYIDVRDLAEFIVDGLIAGHRGVFNAVGPRNGATMADLVHGCRAVTTSDARFTWVPAEDLAELDLHAWRELPVWAPGEGPLSGINQVSIAKAHAAGLGSRTLADTARATLDWWNGLDDARKEKVRFALTREREQAALARWRAPEQEAVETSGDGRTESRSRG